MRVDLSISGNVGYPGLGEGPKITTTTKKGEITALQIFSGEGGKA